MANARFVLGTEIDIASGKELSDGFDALGKTVSAGMARPRRIMRPLTKALSAASLLAVGPTVPLIMGRPSTGRIWVLTSYAVLGNDDHSVLTNIGAAMYIGDPANASLGQCRRPGSQVPFFDTENEAAYVIHDREDLFFNVYATADVATPFNVVGNCTVWEYRDTDIDSQAV